MMIPALIGLIQPIQAFVFELFSDQHPAIAAILAGFAVPIAGNLYLTSAGETYLATQEKAV